MKKAILLTALAATILLAFTIKPPGISRNSGFFDTTIVINPTTHDTLVIIPTDTTICVDTTLIDTISHPYHPAVARAHLLMDYTSELSVSLTDLHVNNTTGWNSIVKCCSYSVARSTAFARHGQYSTRFELNSTDADVASSKRIEASRASNDEGTIAERWYGISYYLPADYNTDPTPELLTQWQSLKGVSPPLALWTQNGKWLLVQTKNTTTALNTIKSSSKELGAYTKGAWTDFVFHVKWSITSAGLVEVWKNGVKITTATLSGPNTYFGIATGNYLKVGIYKWPWKKTDSYTSNQTKRVVYIDDVRIGNASAVYNDVAPTQN